MPALRVYLTVGEELEVRTKVMGKKRVSIEELEAILQEEEDVPIEILPSGEVVKPKTTTNRERGNRVPLTYRENLGGEYYGSVR